MTTVLHNVSLVPECVLCAKTRISVVLVFKATTWVQTVDVNLFAKKALFYSSEERKYQLARSVLTTVLSVLLRASALPVTALQTDKWTPKLVGVSPK